MVYDHLNMRGGISNALPGFKSLLDIQRFVVMTPNGVCEMQIDPMTDCRKKTKVTLRVKLAFLQCCGSRSFINLCWFGDFFFSLFHIRWLSWGYMVTNMEAFGWKKRGRIEEKPTADAEQGEESGV